MVAETLDPLVSQFLRFRFNEDADFIFRSRIADDDPSGLTEFAFRLSDQSGKFPPGSCFFPS